MSPLLSVSTFELSLAVGLGSIHLVASLLLAANRDSSTEIRARLLLSIVPSIAAAAWGIVGSEPSAVAQAASVVFLSAFASAPLVAFATFLAWGFGVASARIGALRVPMAASWLALAWTVLSGTVAATVAGVVFTGSLAIAVLFAAIVLNGAAGAWGALLVAGHLLSAPGGTGHSSRRAINPGSGLPAPARGAPDVRGSQWGDDQ